MFRFFLFRPSESGKERNKVNVKCYEIEIMFTIDASTYLMIRLYFGSWTLCCRGAVQMLRHSKRSASFSRLIQIDILNEVHTGELVNNYVVLVPSLLLASPCMPLKPIISSKCYNYYYITSIKK